MTESEKSYDVQAAEAEPTEERSSDDVLRRIVAEAETIRNKAQEDQDEEVWWEAENRRARANLTLRIRELTKEGMHPEDAAVKAAFEMANVILDEAKLQQQYGEIQYARLAHKQAHEGCTEDCEEMQFFKENLQRTFDILIGKSDADPDEPTKDKNIDKKDEMTITKSGIVLDKEGRHLTNRKGRPFGNYL